MIDPYTVPVLQRTTTWEVMYGLGKIEKEQLNQVSLLNQRCEYYHTEDPIKAVDECNNILAYEKMVSGKTY